LKTSAHFLSGTDFGKGAVTERVEVDLKRLLVGAQLRASSASGVSLRSSIVGTGTRLSDWDQNYSIGMQWKRL